MTVGCIQIQSYSGKSVTDLLSKPIFRQHWDDLFALCPWATAFQSRVFVETWYSVYEQVFEPLVVLGQANDGRLVGFFPLAIQRDSHKLVYAGENQAEYQVWISTPENGNSFIELALDYLASRFPSAELSLLFLPPDSPLGWLDRKRRWADRALLRYFERPLMRVGDGSSIESSLRKKSNKSRLNRLAQIAPLRFDILHTRIELDYCFDQIIDYCDLRSAAKNQSLVFRQDKFKKEFYLRLMEPSSLMHACVLRLGDTVIAAHIGARDRTSVQLGLIAHSPFFAKHSPGKILLLLLGRELAHEGFHDLDLTPCGEYKVRFADHADQVYAISVFFRKSDAIFVRWRQSLARVVKKVLPNSRIMLDIALKRFFIFFHKLKIYGLTGVMQKFLCRLVQEIRNDKEVHFYQISQSLASQMPTDPRFRQDCLSDLFLYEPSSSGDPTKFDFLKYAFERLETGQHVYTISDDTRLLHSAWCGPVSGLRETEIGDQIEYPPNSALLWDDYTHSSSRGLGLHKASIQHRLHEAAAFPGVRNIFISIPDNNTSMRLIIEEAGFYLYATVIRRTRFGKRIWDWRFS